jgi:hypothetical protein
MEVQALNDVSEALLFGASGGGRPDQMGKEFTGASF